MIALTLLPTTTNNVRPITIPATVPIVPNSNISNKMNTPTIPQSQNISIELLIMMIILVGHPALNNPRYLGFQ